MPGFLLRLLISAFGLWVAARIVPGIQIEGTGTLLLGAFLLGLVNAVVRPIVVLFTLPLTILTLGLFLLVVNALMLQLVAAFLSGFHVQGLMAAILGSVIASLTGWIASSFIGPSGRYEVMVVRR